MAITSIPLPTMYADHHVQEVRRILLGLPGVQDVYASSAFQVVEIAFDAEKIDEQRLKDALAQAGYAGELPVPAESGKPVTQSNGDGAHFRHAATFTPAADVVGFQQEVAPMNRPLWPCPGLGPVKTMEE
ncbi:MAG: heavy-metal-associated domain-containing protein [Chloroflexi bacterium]|nr:heavy-metal-associated domain-containing protein [Chloroflexota bacterium]